MTHALDIRNLGKKYTISASSARSSYRTFRDMMTDGLRGMFQSRADTTTSSGEFWALRDMNLTIEPGERVGIIGRNGAGKSTLLKLISRITHPTTGEIRINGRISSLLEVGTGFHPELTGRENIFLNGSILGMSHAEIRRNFDEIVDFAGVEKFLETPVKRYSSGMYTRLAFAVAAHLDSDIMIIDEVLAVGDAEFQKKCLGKMEEMGQKHGRTILFVSHNMNAVNNFCDRIVWMQQGQCIEDGKNVRDITARYLQSDLNGEQAYWAPDTNMQNALRNPFCQPIEFYIGDKDGARLNNTTLANDDEAYVYLTFKADELDSGFTTGYALYTDTGELLYWSYQTDVAEQDWPAIKVGMNTLRARLPSRLLNEGSYRMEWLASLHFRSWLFEPGRTAPALQFKIQDGLSDSPIWFSRRPGLLAPVLPWTRSDRKG